VIMGKFLILSGFVAFYLTGAGITGGLVYVRTKITTMTWGGDRSSSKRYEKTSRSAWPAFLAALVWFPMLFAILVVHLGTAKERRRRQQEEDRAAYERTLKEQEQIDQQLKSIEARLQEGSSEPPTHGVAVGFPRGKSQTAHANRVPNIMGLLSNMGFEPNPDFHWPWSRR